jgi:hypothetical protein
MRHGLMMMMLIPLLAGCSEPEDSDVRGVTAEESAQLNAAASMLDTNSSDLGLPEGNATAKP